MTTIGDVSKRLAPLTQFAENAGGLFGGLACPGWGRQAPGARTRTPADRTAAPATAETEHAAKKTPAKKSTAKKATAKKAAAKKSTAKKAPKRRQEGTAAKKKSDG